LPIFHPGNKYKALDVKVAHRSDTSTLTWLSITCHENKNRVVREALKALYLSVTRMLCVEFGPFTLENLFPQGAGSGSEATIRELQLSPEINAKYLAMINSRTMSKTSVVGGSGSNENSSSSSSSNNNGNNNNNSNSSSSSSTKKTRNSDRHRNGERELKLDN
jgi:hypothetical protein